MRKLKCDNYLTRGCPRERGSFFNIISKEVFIMKQKHYMDIQVWTEDNCKGFQKGDLVVAQEKIDCL